MNKIKYLNDAKLKKQFILNKAKIEFVNHPKKEKILRAIEEGKFIGKNHSTFYFCDTSWHNPETSTHIGDIKAPLEEFFKKNDIYFYLICEK